MYCQHCGKEIIKDSLFCNHCGMQQGIIKEIIERGNVNVKDFSWTFFSISALLLLIISLVSLFLPWTHAESRASGFGQSFSWNSNSFSAIISLEGQLSFILLTASLFFLFKRKNWSYILSGLSILISLVLVFRLMEHGSSISSSFGSASARFKIEYGFIAFTISSVLGTIFSALFIMDIKFNFKLIIDEELKRGFLTIACIISIIVNIYLIIYDGFYRDVVPLLLLLFLLILLYKLNYKYSYLLFLVGAIIIISSYILFHYLHNHISHYFYNKGYIFENPVDNFTDSYDITIIIFKLIFILHFLILFGYEFLKYRKSKPISNLWIRKFKPVYLLVVFIITYSTSYAIFFSTRHYVSDSELRTFNENNNFLNGEWYFLSEDSLNIYRFNINFNSQQVANTGEMDYSFNASIYKDDIKVEENGELRYSSKLNYNGKHKLPLNFNNKLILEQFKINEIRGTYKPDGDVINFVASKTIGKLSLFKLAIEKKITRLKKRRIRYLYYSNGGMIAYFNDGSISSCDKCDATTENVRSLYTKNPWKNRYIVQQDGSLYINSYSTRFPVNEPDMIAEGWAIINYVYMEPWADISNVEEAITGEDYPDEDVDYSVY